MPPLSEQDKSVPNRDAVSAKDALIKMQEMLATAPNKTKLVEALTGASAVRRPATSRAMSRYSYYKERFALEFKVVLDDMIKEHEKGIHEDRMYRYEDFKDLKPNSLYLKVLQSRMYLLDKMDPNKKYANFCELIGIERGDRDDSRYPGIRLFYQLDIINGQSFMPSKILNKQDSLQWKEEVERFIEEAREGEELKIEKLAICNDDVNSLRESLEPIENIISKITNRSIFLVKI